MGAMLKQLWLSFTTLFMALENAAATVNTIAIVGREMSETYLDETRAQRQMQLNALNKQIKASE